MFKLRLPITYKVLWLFLAIVGMYIAVFSNTFEYRIIGTSMMPNILEGNAYTAFKVQGLPVRHDIYTFNGIALDRSQVFIKRLIGIPGDSLTFRLSDGALIKVNNVAVNYQIHHPKKGYSLTSNTPEHDGSSINVYAYQQLIQARAYAIYHSPEEQILPANIKQRAYWQSIMKYPWLEKYKVSGGHANFSIPKGYYFFLSDNRIGSYDSRHFGLVPLKAIKERVLLNNAI
jgi:signal peptidase I